MDKIEITPTEVSDFFLKELGGYWGMYGFPVNKPEGGKVVTFSNLFLAQTDIPLHTSFTSLEEKETWLKDKLMILKSHCVRGLRAEIARLTEDNK